MEAPPNRSSSAAREVCSATLSFPAHWAGDAATNRLGHRYRQSWIDVAIAHSVLEQHSSLGGSAFSHRNDGERRLVRVTWPLNCNSYLGFYWSRLCVCCGRFPEAIGFFSSLMKIDFITALTSSSPRSPHRNLLHGAHLGSRTLFASLKIRRL